MAKTSSDLTKVTTVGLDLAKVVFQVHAIAVDGAIVVARAIRRPKVLGFFAGLPKKCLVGMEACGSSYHWARALIDIGHDVRILPPAYVKAYVRRQKNDAADAAAICEAVARPSMRFVPLRSIDNQAALMQHKVRELLVAQRTQLINALRSHLSEVGIIAAQGASKARELADLVAGDENDEATRAIPEQVRVALAPLVRQVTVLDDEIEKSNEAIRQQAAGDATAKRLMSIPGIGVLTASAIIAIIQNISQFSGPREFAAFLGLAPRQHSSGGKEKLGRVSKMGNRYLRKLLVVGACAVLRHCNGHDDTLRTWARKLLEHKSFKLVAVALANKLARIVFAVMRDGAVWKKIPA
jgi:transposase